MNSYDYKQSIRLLFVVIQLLAVAVILFAISIPRASAQNNDANDWALVSADEMFDPGDSNADAPMLAPRTDEYQLTWFTVGGGGAMASQDGVYALGATAGEPATGTMSNGEFSLESGFWSGMVDASNLYLPLIQR